MSSEKQGLSQIRERDWIHVIFQLQLSLSFLCGLHFIINEAYWRTTFFSIFIIFLGFLGVAAGSHRLWAHGSYKASTGLRLFLAICQTLVGHGSIYDWVRYHRLHHKHFNTALDPYNPSKGLFYAHFSSTSLKLSEAQEKALEEIDMSDLEQDKIVMFQKKYYIPLFLIVTLLLPINAPAEYWNETIVNSVFILGWFRWFVLLHMSWLIHSATKIWGLQPGEKYPCDTNLVFILTKNHWLSYHYLAPWDYQTSEYSKYGTDIVSKFIRVCAAMEYATDLKTVDSKTVRSALVMSLKEKKSISECLLEKQKSTDVPNDHYLSPSQYRGIN